MRCGSYSLASQLLKSKQLFNLTVTVTSAHLGRHLILTDSKISLNESNTTYGACWKARRQFQTGCRPGATLDNSGYELGTLWNSTDGSYHYDSAKSARSAGCGAMKKIILGFGFGIWDSASAEAANTYYMIFQPAAIANTGGLQVVLWQHAPGNAAVAVQPRLNYAGAGRYNYPARGRHVAEQLLPWNWRESGSRRHYHHRRRIQPGIREQNSGP